MCESHSPPPRPLTERERLLTRWMIEHGSAEQAEKERLLSQLDRASVVRHCSCGCESVGFAIDGKETPVAGMRIVGDFMFGDASSPCGVFVFCSDDVLAGIEVYSLSGQAPCRELPSPSELRPFVT